MSIHIFVTKVIACINIVVTKVVVSINIFVIKTVVCINIFRSRLMLNKFIGLLHIFFLLLLSKTTNSCFLSLSIYTLSYFSY